MDFGFDIGIIKELIKPAIVIFIGIFIGFTIFNAFKPWLLKLKEKLLGNVEAKLNKEKKEKYNKWKKGYEKNKS